MAATPDGEVYLLVSSPEGTSGDSRSGRVVRSTGTGFETVATAQGGQLVVGDDVVSEQGFEWPQAISVSRGGHLFLGAEHSVAVDLLGAAPSVIDVEPLEFVDIATNRLSRSFRSDASFHFGIDTLACALACGTPDNAFVRQQSFHTGSPSGASTIMGTGSEPQLYDAKLWTLPNGDALLWRHRTPYRVVGTQAQPLSIYTAHLELPAEIVEFEGDDTISIAFQDGGWSGIAVRIVRVRDAFTLRETLEPDDFEERARVDGVFVDFVVGDGIVALVTKDPESPATQLHLVADGEVWSMPIEGTDSQDSPWTDTLHLAISDRRTVWVSARGMLRSYHRSSLPD